MTKRAISADGKVHEFPNGTDDAVMDRAMADYARANPRQAPVPTRDATGVNRSTEYVDPVHVRRLRDGKGAADFSILNGATFGTLPLIDGAMGAAAAVPDALRQRSIAPLGQAYRNNRDVTRQVIADGQRENFVGALAGEVAGGLMTGGIVERAASGAIARSPALTALSSGAARVAAPVRAAIAPVEGARQLSVPAVARGAARLGVSSGAGALGGSAYGGLYALGQGTDIVDGMQTGALFGAAFAPSANALGQRAGRVIAEKAPVVASRVADVVAPRSIHAANLRRAANVATQTRTARLSQRAVSTAARDLVDQFRQNNVSAQDVTRTLRELQDAGVIDVRVFDAAKAFNAQSVIANARAVARRSAVPRAMATNYSNEVAANSGTNVGRAAAELSPRQRSVAGTATGLADSRASFGSEIMRPVPQDAPVQLSPDAIAALRVPNMRKVVRDVEDGLRGRAVSGGDRLSQQADVLATIRAGEQSSNVRPAAFDVRKSQAYQDNLDIAQGGLAPFPVPSNTTRTLPQAMRMAGGLRERDASLLRQGLTGPARVGEGESVLGSANRLPGVINNKSGLDPADMAENLRQSGYLGEGRLPSNEWDANAAQMSDVFGSTDDMTALLREYTSDPQRFRYGRNSEYLAKFDDWLAGVNNADQMGLGARNQAEARGLSAQRAYDDYVPAGPDRFEGVPFDEPLPSQLDINTIEALRSRMAFESETALAGGNKDLSREFVGEGGHYDLVTGGAKEQIPQYKQMLNMYAESHGLEGALRSGNKNALALNPEELRLNLEKYTPDERSYFGQGVAQSLSDHFSPIHGGGVTRAAPLGFNRLYGENLGEVFGVPNADRFQGQAQTYVNRFREANALNPNMGSQTANNLEGQSGLDELGDALGAVPAMASGKAGLLRAVIDGAGRVANYRSPAAREAYMRALLEMPPEQASAMLLRQPMEIEPNNAMVRGLARYLALSPARQYDQTERR